MARMTFRELLQVTQDACIDDSYTTQTGLSTSEDFLKREINNTVDTIFSLMRKYSLRPLPKTASTVAAQIYYYYPPGLTKLESVTINIGSISPPLKVIHSQEEWDRLQTFPISSGLPSAIFPRRDDFGIYPTPQGVYTLTLNGNYTPMHMTNNDYTTGTVAATSGSRTLTGTSTVWTAAMVGRWFCLTNNGGLATGFTDGNWYRISAFVDATHLTLETYFQDTSITGGTYKIGESPEIPIELHEFIAYRAASVYYSMRRRDATHGQELMNYFYTGDYDNPKRSGKIQGGVLQVLSDLKERGSANSQLVEMGGVDYQNIFETGVWATTISE